MTSSFSRFAYAAEGAENLIGVGIAKEPSCLAKEVGVKGVKNGSRNQQQEGSAGTLACNVKSQPVIGSNKTTQPWNECRR